MFCSPIWLLLCCFYNFNIGKSHVKSGLVISDRIFYGDYKRNSHTLRPVAKKTRYLKFHNSFHEHNFPVELFYKRPAGESLS